MDSPWRNLTSPIQVEVPATEEARRIPLSSGYILQNYWDLLEAEFRPKGNKLLSVIELWT